MFTVCPKCALTLVVTAADLRVAQGYVRCGRCSSVFNALAGLSDERQPATEAAPPAPPAQAEPPAAEVTPDPPEPTAPQASAADPEPEAEAESLEFNEATDVDSVFVQAQPDPQWTAATGSFRALIAANQESATPAEEQPLEVDIDANFFASMLGSESANEGPQESAGAAPSQLQASAAPPAPASAAPPVAANEETQVPAPPVTGRAARAPVRLVAVAAREDLQAAEGPGDEPAAPAEAEEAEETEETATLAWRAEAAWVGGSVLALLLLGAQVVNHYRDALATRPALRTTLQSIYGALGVALYPQWDLRAYDVRQLGADAGTSGTGLITVRASVKNAAAQPQPLPLLRVTLQDRFGNRIASRDVAPRSYLPAAVAAGAYLSAGQRIDAEMGFADPGAEAVGFEIDACLPARGGAIACANDATLR
ncbi:MAG: zinc-ribbon and DUF3426 domain-containing protein [Gammaproteobacteria bacterium]|nr:zinc-ribbon and DUF3426 domain-containing protein [Gammaproteobacteria bacterium]